MSIYPISASKNLIGESAGKKFKKLIAITLAFAGALLILPAAASAAIVTDAGSMPISGGTSWAAGNTPGFTQPVQFQSVRNIRATSTNLRLLYVNNTDKYINFLASVRKNFVGTPEMVTVNGTTTIRIAPYSATTSDQLSFSVGTGDYVYDRSFFPTASSSQVFSSGMIYGTYNPEAVTVSGSLNTANAMAGYATTSSSRLLEINKTFEHDISFESLNYYQFGAYAVVGIPTDPNLKFTNLVGDSKTADTIQDTTGSNHPWHMIAFGKKNGIPFQNLALPGDNISTLTNPAAASPAASYQLRRSLLDAFPADTVNHYGTNSLDNGQFATTSTATELGFISQLKTIIGAGNRLFQATIDPVARKSATSSWTTVTEADQTNAGDNNNGINNSVYFNNFIKTQKPSYIDGVLDITSPVTTANGFWLPNMTGDGIHQGNGANVLQGNAFAAVWPVSTSTQAISTIAATSSASTTATITWNTSFISSTRVNYGLLSSISSYAASTTEIATSTRVLTHTAGLSNLRPCTKYNFQVDGYSALYIRATSTNQSFITVGCTGSASVATSTDSNVITTTSGGTFNFGTTTVTIPASFTSTSTSAVFQAKQLDRPSFVATAGVPSGKTQAGTYVLNLTALVDATTTLSTFNQPISVTLAYTDSDIAGLSASTLKIYRYDAGTGWTLLDNCTRDSVAKTVTCTTTHFSDFGIFGDAADTNPPVVSMTSPTDGSIVSGSSVAVSANSSDDTAVVGVQFYRDSNVAIGAEDTTSTYGVLWDSTGASNGSHTLFAVSRDAAGNYATSSPVTVTVDNAAPSVTVTAPTSGLVVAGSSVTFSANSTDNVGVVGVQFYRDGTVAVGAEDTSSPYSVTWDSTSVADGSHFVAAVSRDAAGNRATSTVTFIVDNTAPVRSTALPTGTLTTNTSTTTISLVTDEAATCKYSTSNVTAYGSMTSFANTGGTSHSAFITGLTNGGSYIYYAKCQDGVGNINGTDFSISFTVAADANAPVVVLTAPTNNQVIGGSAVAISANATDNVSVAGVQFKVDGVNLGAEDTTSAYGVTWDTTGYSDGVHALTAVARDGTGNFATSSMITVTVDNTAPSRSSGLPSTVLTSGTTGTTLSVVTNEAATCKYSTSSGISYASMTSFGTTGGTVHSSSVSGLSDGSSYTYYVKCRDSVSNTNITDYLISFSVASVPVVSSGGFSTETTTVGGLTYTTKGGVTTVTGTSDGSTGSGSSNNSSSSNSSSQTTTTTTTTSQTTSNPAVTTQATTTAAVAGCPAGAAFNGMTGAACPASTVQLLVPNLAAATYNFTKNLILGSIDSQVKDLQKFLNSHGFTVAKAGAGSAGKETTTFGPATQNALIKFQKANGIKPAVGYFGPVTRKFVSGL